MFEPKAIEALVEVPIEILPEHISEPAMAGIIENFILREGTDYGRVEVTYEKKAEQIRGQIESGKIKIIFDQTTETVSLITANDFKRLNNAHNNSQDNVHNKSETIQGTHDSI